MRPQKNDATKKVIYECRASDKLEQIVAALECLILSDVDDDMQKKGMMLMIDELDAFRRVMEPMLKVMFYNQQYQQGYDN